MNRDHETSWSQDRGFVGCEVVTVGTSDEPYLLFAQYASLL